MKTLNMCVVLAVALAPMAVAEVAAPTIQGNYLESRSCDVYVAACFANGEVNVAGKEATLAWDVTEGSWKGVDLAGLQVVAVVKANATLGDPSGNPYPTESVIIVDEEATERQKAALVDFAKTMSNGLVDEVVKVDETSIDMDIRACTAAECARLTAGDAVEIAARCVHDGDKHCGNEVAFYEPLTDVDNAMVHFAKRDRFSGEGLGLTWDTGVRSSVYIGTFSR